MEKKIYTVQELNAQIKQLLEQNLPTLWLEGEISNFKPHYSGHIYFTLKDEFAQVSAVIWKSRAENIPFDIEDGMYVQVLGNIRVFEKSGRYQIDILQILPAGSGKLQVAFEQLKNKLFSEGLFSEEHKKIIPEYPFCLGIITSPTGAAIRDILQTLKRRAPHVDIIFRPAKVQGIGAAEDLCQAVIELNKSNLTDIIIIGRGGGSLEDLWAFNDESLARTIFNSAIPVISAVGHEIDYTICDFVADLRAPTPSGAAELAVKSREEIYGYLNYLEENIENSLKKLLERNKTMLESLINSYGIRRLQDQVYQNYQLLDDYSLNLSKNFVKFIQSRFEKINHLREILNTLSPDHVLKRGYSITRLDDRIVSDAKYLKKGNTIKTDFFSGSVKSKIEEIRKK